MDDVLAGLRAAAEPTRMRLLALCAHGDLTVTELTNILGQSQPRVSRHLKLMCEAGLLDRIREGAWVFYRLASRGGNAEMARRLLDLITGDDPILLLDQSRLKSVKDGRAAAAAAYFRANADHWHAIRSLHVDDAEVEAALRTALAGRPLGELLDIGTGTGRILEVLAPEAERALGVDASREMLAVARTNLERAGLSDVQVRQGDMYALPLPDASVDTAVLHQVLHFADDPGRAVAEAARVLRPGGRLVIVDFAPHEQETLRQEHSHRRLGFSDAEVNDWLSAAALRPHPPTRLPGQPLTVVLWLAEKSSGDQT